MTKGQMLYKYVVVGYMCDYILITSQVKGSRNSYQKCYFFGLYFNLKGVTVKGFS